MSEKVKIKYRTDKTRCNPEYTEYLEDKKFQLGEHEFTPHRNKNDNNIPVDDMQYEMVRFAIAYIQDKDTIQENACYVNKSHDDKYWVQEYKRLTTTLYKCDETFKKFGLKKIYKFLAIEYYNNVKEYETHKKELEEVQNAVRNGDYDMLLTAFPVGATNIELERITKAVNGYNQIVEENNKIQTSCKQVLEENTRQKQKLEQVVKKNDELAKRIKQLETIKKEQANIFKNRKEKYNTQRKHSRRASWAVFICICGLIALRAKMIIDGRASFVDGILPILPLTLSLSVAFYILRRTVYRNEILEIEYEHKEVHAEFYTSLLANDINKDDEEIKQFHRNVYLETLNHNPVENVMKKHKNDDEQTTKLLDKIIEVLKTRV